jgi:hypothetical protein
MIVGAYPVPAWTVESQAIYAQCIEDLDGGATRAAVMYWLKTHAERPAIADIRAAARQQLEIAGAIPTDPDVDQAWGIVLEAIRRVGRYQPFPATHQAVKAAVDRMGWEDICNAENMEVIRAQFERFYRAELTREREARHAAPALARPDDQARLAGPAASKAVGGPDSRRALPAPPDRVVSLDSIRQIREQLRHGLREVPTVPVAETKEQPKLREPTDDEIRAAENRRRELHEQAASLA